MNLQKLFQMQRKLDENIEKNNPLKQGENRFDHKILALYVELGECANEWRGFKFWSKDREPRTKVPVVGWGEPYKNSLLEEYVDGLHFVMSIGIDLIENPDDLKYTPYHYEEFDEKNIINQFNNVYGYIDLLYGTENECEWYEVMNHYLGLGVMLGFTQEMIEQAYFDKNQINHQRQEEGY